MVVAVLVVVDGAEPAAAAPALACSASSFNCRSLLKYRSEANSVMWRGSMVKSHALAAMPPSRREQRREGSWGPAGAGGTTLALGRRGSSIWRAPRREE